MVQKELEAREELGIPVESKDVFGRRAATFDKLVEDRNSIKELQKQIETELKDIDDKLKLFLADTETKTVIASGSRVTQCQGSNSSLKKELLIEKGVAAQVIKDCTVTKTYDYILVTAIKEKA